MTKQTATIVVKSFWVLCLVALALLFCGCRTKPAKSFYVPPSSVVEVTDPAPAIKSVDRAVTRVEGFKARNEGATKKYLNAWTIGKLIPLGGDLINSTENVVTKAIGQ